MINSLSCLYSRRIIIQRDARRISFILKELGLTTLETRRTRGDWIEAFKVIKGFEDVDSELFFPLAVNNIHLRGHV